MAESQLPALLPVSPSTLRIIIDIAYHHRHCVDDIPRKSTAPDVNIESHAFMFTPHPANGIYRIKCFEALITSTSDSALISSLQGGIFPLTQLPEMLRRLVELTADKRTNPRYRGG
jgi:hypothetical protein